MLLSRYYTPTATWGVFVNNGKPICVSLELPWLDNKENISCIPEGEYQCERIISPSNGDCYHIKDVKDRTNVQIHVANLLEEIKGCVAIGSSFGEINGKEAVLGSKKALDRLKEIAGDKFKLMIKGA